jgi:hypothetical protein
MRLLGLLFPTENFERIQRGLTSDDVNANASSRELIENLLQLPLRTQVLALIDDAPDPDRLERAVDPYVPAAVEYKTLILEFLKREDELGTLATYHAAETGLAVLPRAGSTSRKKMAGLIERAAATAVVGVGS